MYSGFSLASHLEDCYCLAQTPLISWTEVQAEPLLQAAFPSPGHQRFVRLPCPQPRTRRFQCPQDTARIPSSWELRCSGFSLLSLLCHLLNNLLLLRKEECKQGAAMWSAAHEAACQRKQENRTIKSSIVTPGGIKNPVILKDTTHPNVQSSTVYN